MQRNIAAICFLLAAIALGVAAGAWWLQFTVFTPDDTVGKTEAILDDDEIRADITTIVAAATAGTLDRTPTEIAADIGPMIHSRAGAGVMTEIVRDAHARAIGNRAEPVRITGEQMILIVRDELVADLAPVTLPVAEISTLRILGNALGWVAAVTAILGVVIALFGLIMRPEGSVVLLGLGELLLALGACLVVIGYLVPVFVLPAINDTTWAGAVPRLAMRTFPLGMGISVVFVALGLFIVLRSSGSGRRKQWSTPLSVGRYRDERSWS